MPHILSGRFSITKNANYYAVGSATAKLLLEAGIDASFPKDKMTSEGLLELVPFSEINGENVALIKGEGGRDYLAAALEEADIPILGTPRDVIDRAEDRERFQQMIDTLHLKQAKSAIAYDTAQALQHAKEISYPILLRPSYVLGGRAMRVVYDDDSLKHYMQEASAVTRGGI